jgi:ATP-binding cassette subfamily B multidrug efflux pump
MHSLRRILAFLRPYRTLAVLAPLFMLLEVVMDLTQPYLMEHIVDVGIARLDMPVVLHTAMLMVGFAFIGLIGGVGCTVAAVRAATSAATDLRSALFAKVQAFSFANLDRLGTGPLITRLTNDVTQIQDVIQVMLRILVRTPLLTIGCLIMAIVTSPQLALLFVVLVPVLLAILTWGIRRSFPLFLRVQATLDRLNTIAQENLAGIRLVKAFVRGQHEWRRFRDTNEDLVANNLRVANLMAITMPLIMLTTNLGVAAVIWYGGIKVVQHGLLVGQVLAFVNYLAQMLGNLIMVGLLLIRVSRAEASAERIVTVLDMEPEVKDRPGALADFRPRGRVEFEHVSFGYGDGRVLEDINLVAEPGQMVAILGATGSGKSTLVQLIPRFYDVTAGRVTLDGVDVRDIRSDVLRRSVSIALQESVLFSGTIRDNIRYGRPDATDEEVEAAARAAQAHDFISSLPDGYDTQLGQRGVNLSGGQKQRLAIARALICRPAVLILDDSTSAISMKSSMGLSAWMATTFGNSRRIACASSWAPCSRTPSSSPTR